MSNTDPIIDEELLKDLKDLAEEGEVLPMSLFNKFFETAEERLIRLKEFQSQGNFAEIQSLSHSLKGSSYNLAAKRMGKAAYELEISSKEKNVEQLDTHIQNLASEYALFKKKIQDIVDAH